MLCRFQQSAEVQHRFDIGIVEVLFNNLATKFDIVYAKEDIPGKLLPTPSLAIKLEVVLDFGIDFKQDICQSLHFGAANILLAENLVCQIMRINNIHIPQSEIGDAKTDEVLCQRCTNRTTSNNVNASLNLFWLEVLVAFGQIHCHCYSPPRYWSL